MDAEHEASKPDGSAWEAHMERVNARNDAARKEGRAERAQQERSNAASLHEVELRQAAERRRHFDRQAGSGGLSRSVD